MEGPKRSLHGWQGLGTEGEGGVGLRGGVERGCSVSGGSWQLTRGRLDLQGGGKDPS